MVEDSVWQKYPEDVTRHLKRCLVDLALSGVLQAQVDLETTRLVEGDSSQPLDELAKEILRVRADTQGLRLIHNYGLTLAQEFDIGDS